MAPQRIWWEFFPLKIFQGPPAPNLFLQRWFFVPDTHEFALPTFCVLIVLFLLVFKEMTVNSRLSFFKSIRHNSMAFETQPQTKAREPKHLQVHMGALEWDVFWLIKLWRFLQLLSLLLVDPILLLLLTKHHLLLLRRWRTLLLRKHPDSRLPN